jgi:hypothetical protein
MPARTAGSVLRQLRDVALGGLKVGVPRGRPPIGALVRLATAEEALEDVRRTHPEAYCLLPDPSFSPSSTPFGNSALEKSTHRAAKKDDPTIQHVTERVEGGKVSWTERPLVIGSRAGVCAALDAAESDPARAAWARTRRKGIAALGDGESYLLGKVYRSCDGRLRDRTARATTSGKLGERACLQAQPGHLLVDLDLTAAHLASAWLWAGEVGDPAKAREEFAAHIGVDHGAGKIALLAWINGAGKKKLDMITGTGGTRAACETKFLRVAAFLGRIRHWWKASSPGDTLDTRDLHVDVPEEWHLRLIRPKTWRRLASRMWTRPEALWLDRALGTVTRGGIEAAVAVPIYDGLLIQMPASPWLQVRLTYLVGVLNAQAERVGLPTRVKATILGKTWAGGGPPGAGGAGQRQTQP